jgi:hypothetical protein
MTITNVSTGTFQQKILVVDKMIFKTKIKLENE